MASASIFPPLFLLFLFSLSGAGATTFTLLNNCRITVWPGILPDSGKPAVGNGGLRLRPGQSTVIPAPTGWSGRFWPRTGCRFDKSRQGKCQTGDCGGMAHCNTAGGTPPASLAEFTLDSPIDYYDVGLVDGYNVAVSVVPSGSRGGNCQAVECVSNVNRICPKALQMVVDGRVVACKSACLAFGTPQYCCTGQYANPQTCKPTVYSRLFKKACPKAYSYAYDDATSTFTCIGADYLIRFC